MIEALRTRLVQYVNVASNLKKDINELQTELNKITTEIAAEFGVSEDILLKVIESFAPQKVTNIEDILNVII